MQLTVGSVVEGKITGITNFGAFVELEDKKIGMVHISEVSSTYVKDIKEHLKENQVVKVKVLSIGEDGKISLSIKRAEAPAKEQPQKAPRQSYNNDFQKKSNAPMSFEDMMARFKSVSDEKMSDLKKSNVAKRGASTPRRGGNNPRG